MYVRTLNPPYEEHSIESYFLIHSCLNSTTRTTEVVEDFFFFWYRIETLLGEGDANALIDSGEIRYRKKSLEKQTHRTEGGLTEISREGKNCVEMS